MTRRLRLALTIVMGALLVAPVVALSQGQDAEDLPPAGEPVPAGRYVTDVLGPTLDFRVEDGWRSGPDVTGPIITLESTTVPGGVLTMTIFDGSAFADSCDPTSITTVDASLERAAEIIGANPLLRVAPPIIRDVDGNRAVQLDVGVPALGEECAAPFILLWAVPEMEAGEFVQVGNQQSRFIIVEVGTDIVVIAIETFPELPFGPVLDASMDIVDSLRITPSGSPTATNEPSSDASPAPTPAASPDPTPAATPQAQRTPTPMATDAPDA